MRTRRILSATHAAVLWLSVACIVAFGPAGNVFKAHAQVTAGVASPPEDAPAMHPGVRVPRPFGEVEISTFSESRKDQDTVFTVELVIRNETRNKIQVDLRNAIRLIADGVPRAPETTSQRCCPEVTEVQLESAEYGSATFRVHGQPAAVYLRFGTGEEVSSYLRWPQ